MNNNQVAKKKKPLITVVILSWNRKEEVIQTLTNLSMSRFRNFEVILVDNSSSDGTVEAVSKAFPEVRTIRLPDNRGLYGYNVGFANARGKYVVVLDDDSHPARESLGKIARAFREDRDKKIGIIAMEIVNSSTGRIVTESWPEGDWITFWGCGAAIRKELLDDLGGYDEDFFIYANEYDLAIRAMDAGWRVVYRPDIVAYHRECKKHRSWKRTGLTGARNEAWFHIKHFPWYIIPVLSVITCSRYLIKGITKRSASYAAYSLGGYLRGLATFWKPLARRKVVSKSVAWKFLRHHWLTAPVWRYIPVSLKES